MIKDLNLVLTPEVAADQAQVKTIAAETLGVVASRIKGMRITRKTVDARQSQAKINLSLLTYIDEALPEGPSYSPVNYLDVSEASPVIVVGAGPAGLFASLRLIELGVKPILIERGKSVSERKLDIAAASRNKGLNPESNFCFGEGGAGTFSDGKLYTRSKKKGSVSAILEIFHQHGAQDEILYETHPHIGTDRLSVVVRNMRETILRCGGEVHFSCRMSELLISEGEVRGIRCADGREFESPAVILATGHSARDVYYMLDDNGITLEPKGFAMGVRVEHPQALVDSIQYHHRDRGEYLPPASYNLVAQSSERGVYSFCMCPGGQIVPASTDNDGLVVNGMSNSLRNSPYANSGVVVEIRPEDLHSTEWADKGCFAGLYFQKYVEGLSLRNNGGQGLTAPAQRLADFVRGKLSSDLPECSYLPGVVSSPLHFWLPDMISSRLRDGFKQFDRKMHGFVTNEAVVVGVESRSSSPVRIPRDRVSMQHVSVRGLFPCGEGAGYAGGITSSAVDGRLCAERAAELVKKV